MPSFSLTNRVAIVTGASQGIGAAIATQLAVSGAKTVVHYILNKSNALKVVEAIKKSGGVAQVFQGELSDVEQFLNMLRFENRSKLEDMSLIS